MQNLISGLCQLHLGGIAQHILGAINATGEYAKLKEQWLAMINLSQTGLVPWASRKRRFAANIAALSGTSPDLVMLSNFWESAQCRYELYIAADGNCFVFDTQASSPFAGVLGGINNHLADAQQWSHQKNGQQLIMPIAFNGVGYGWLLNKILSETEHSFLNYSCAAYIVEPEPAAACIWLHVHDLRAQSPRLRIFTGESAADNYKNALMSHTSWSLPAVFINQPLMPRADLPLESLRNEVMTLRQAQQDQFKQQAQAYYDSITREQWRERFTQAHHGQRKLTILGITTRYSTVLRYSLEELAEAIKAAGHEFVLAWESDDQSLERQDLELIAKHKPDLIVQISRMRYENPNLPRNIPFLCWDQDNLPCMRTPEARESLDFYTYVAGHAAPIGYGQLNWPRRNCIFVHAAGQVHRYGSQNVSPELLTRHAYDFSYISNASVTPEAYARELADSLSHDKRMLSLFCESVAEVLARANAGENWGPAPLRAFVRQKAADTHCQLADSALLEVEMTLQRLVDRAFRHVTLRWVADYCRNTGHTLRIYGAGWDKTPGLSEFAAGVASQGEEILAIYRASRINLQIIESGMLHSRLLDGIAAGGFFMNRAALIDGDDTPELRDRFSLAQWVRDHNITSLEQIEKNDDPQIRRKYQAIYEEYQATDALPVLFPALVVMGYLRPAFMICPSLNRIRFHSQQEFVEQADYFLSREQERAELSEKIRGEFIEHFSYDTRWREFLAGIVQGMSA